MRRPACGSWFFELHCRCRLLRSVNDCNKECYYDRNPSRPERDNDDSQWRRLQTTSADLEHDERSKSNRLLSSILEELRQLTGKVERDEVKQEEINDWRFAAMVVDRLCLIAFTSFTVVSTFTILLSAPSFHARWPGHASRRTARRRTELLRTVYYFRNKDIRNKLFISLLVVDDKNSTTILIIIVNFWTP